MEEDLRKQGMLYLQQQRFGKVGRRRPALALAATVEANLRSPAVSRGAVTLQTSLRGVGSSVTAPRPASAGSACGPSSTGRTPAPSPDWSSSSVKMEGAWRRTTGASASTWSTRR